MKKEKKEKNFLNLPKYPGGNAAFRKFIEQNLKYPEEAIKNNIRGEVMISFEVSDDGDVVSVKVIKGLGYGCDEEAIRLIKMLKYEKVRNHGMRVKSTVKTTIHFKYKKPAVQFTYNLTSEEKKTKEPEKPQSSGGGYNYSITIK